MSGDAWLVAGQVRERLDLATSSDLLAARFVLREGL